MTVPELNDSEREGGARFLFALNAASAQLQRSARSEADVYRVFSDQIVKLGLNGSINLLIDGGEKLKMVVAAVPWDEITRFDGIDMYLPELQPDLDTGTFQFSVPVSASDIFKTILTKGESIFEQDNSEFIRSFVPGEYKGFLREVLARFGGQPAIYAPLIIEGEVHGLLTVNGAGLSAAHIPLIEAFSNHVAIALENANLISVLQAQVSKKMQTENALRESEQKYRGIVRQSTDGIILLDEQGLVIEWNEGMERITGLKQSQTLGQPIWDIQFSFFPSGGPPEEHKQKIIERIQELLRTGKSPWIGDFHENDIRRTDGELRTIQVVLYPLKSEKGTMLCSIVRDITERIGMERALRRRADELAALQALSLDLTTVHELPVLLTNIVEKAVQLLGAKGGSLYLSEPENEKVRSYVDLQSSSQDRVGATINYGEGAAGVVAQSGKPLIIDDYRIWPGRIKAYDTVQPYSAVLTVPMVWQGEVTGVLQVLDDFDVRRFSRDDQEILTLFANHASVALETTRLLDAERRRRREAETLGKGSAALTSTLEVDQLLDVILTHLEQVVPYKSASVFLMEGNILQIVAGKGFEDSAAVVGSTIPVENDSLFLELQRSKQSLIIPDVHNDQRFRGWGGVKHVRGWLGTPLIVRGEVIGCLTLDNEEPGLYNAGHAALVETFANQAATAIEKARLFKVERESRRRAEAVRDAAHIISSSLSMHQVLEEVLDQLARVVSYDSANIMLLENGSAVIKVWRGYEKSAAEVLVETIRFGLSSDHAVGIVVESGKPLLIANINDDPRWQATPLSDHINSWLGVPLIVRDKVIGLLNLDRAAVGGFTDDDVTIVQTFAAHAAVAIDNARLYERAATERRHLRLLYDIGRELASSLDYEEILDRAISRTCQVFDGMMGQAFLYIPEVERLWLCALHCAVQPAGTEFDPSLEIDLDTGLAGWVARHRQPANIPDVGKDERWHHVPGLDDGVRSVITAPIKAGEQIFGVLSVLHDEVAAFSMDQLDLLQTICHEVGLVLSNAERYQEVTRRLAEITLIQDLTEIFNRRLELNVLFDEVVEQLYRRFKYPLVEIFLIREEQLELQAFRGDQPRDKYQSIQMGIVGRVARSGEAEFVPDVSRDTDYICWSQETVAELAVPIFRDDKVIGVINIESDKTNQLSTHDSDLLQVLAGQISIALENAVLYGQVRQHAEELELTVDQRTLELTSLYELSQKIGHTVGFEDLLRLLLSHLRNAVGCDLSSACLVVEGHRLFFIESSREIAPAAVQSLRELTLNELVKQNRDTKRLETAPLELVQTSDLDSKVPAIEKLESLIYAPIKVGWKTVGALITASDEKSAFSDYQQRLLETFAHQAGSAVERIVAILVAEQKRVEGLVEHLPVGLILLDSEYRLQVTNPIAKSILTALEADTPDGNLLRLGNYPIEDLISHHKDPIPVEIIQDKPSHRVYEAQARPMGGGSQQWVIMLREITEEKEIQTRIQMQERLATVGQLAAGIAHDFNNIMAAILVYTDLLMGDPNLPQASRDRLTIIEQQVQRAASLIRQILDFSRRAVMEQSALDLLPFVKELERMLGRVMPETIRLELEYKPGSYWVKADPTRLQQVFINLAVNARDAMPDGGVLHFSLGQIKIPEAMEPPSPDLLPGEWVKITVRDSGCGIPPDVTPHIFEPFFTTKPVGQGTGLGLAQVYGIIKQHGGHIDVSSKVDKGTEFTLFLPLLPESSYEIRHTEPLAPLDGSGKVVLVVEDDHATLAALQALLEAKNYDVITARNGYEAIQLYDQTGIAFALVVSDVVMPQMDGVKLYRALMDRSPEMKMLFVTGHPLEGENQALLERGDVHWLQKPFSAREFTRMVQNLMDM